MLDCSDKEGRETLPITLGLFTLRILQIALYWVPRRRTYRRKR